MEEELKRAQPQIEAIAAKLHAQPARDVEILRVNQLDALRLDEELYELLKAQLLKALSCFQADFIEKYQPEISGLLHLVLFRLSIGASDTTYGNKLQNLIYRDGSAFKPLQRHQKILYGLLYIGGGWFWARLNRYITSAGWGDFPADDWRRRLWVIVGYAETAWKLFSVLNFLVFLFNGRYRSVIDRALGIRLAYLHPTMARSVSFEYMNRQLVWHGFTEFLMFMMPLVNLERIKTWVYKKLQPRRSKASASASSASSSEDPCLICNSNPMNTPYVTSCGHFFCYFCIKQNLMADSKFPCPRCDKQITSLKRYTVPEGLS